MDASEIQILGRGSFTDVSSLPFFSPKLYVAGLQSQMVPRKEKKKLIKNKQVNGNPEILTMWNLPNVNLM